MRTGQQIMKGSIFIAVLLTNLACSNCVALTWRFTDNPTALCNDFTRAGFFHRKPSSGDQKWVVFLESGALCYSNETCNRRYFQSYLRQRYSTDFLGQTFDTELAWSETGAAGQPLTEVVNPLMRSTYCFRDEAADFDDNKDFTAEGRDILSRHRVENPTFYQHGHVLVPYCSSDLWLGNEDATSRDYPSLLQQEPCDCLDQSCFRYNPTSEDLQFTFRGQTIFRSVLQTLDTMYDLQSSSEIVLVGSSAGGLGVLNSAKWVREQFPNVTLKVVVDSAWFVNFRDGINREFGAAIDTSTEGSGRGVSSLTDNIVNSNEACTDTRLGYSCCLSPQCVLSERSITTRESYYPADVPLFVLTSVYDLFILAAVLAGMNSVDNSGVSGAGLALQFITTVGEYGGAMNASLIETATVASRTELRFSFFATQCFQHVYLATSTLREDGGLLGSGIVMVNEDVAIFEQRIQSVWNDQVLAYYDNTGYTIRDAIDYWYLNVSETEEGVVFRDVCSGPHCSNVCPEEIILQTESAAEDWSGAARIAIAAVVLTIAVVCLLLKLYCFLWYRGIVRQQKRFLNTVIQKEVLSFQSEFPTCTDDDAISVACLDLHYHVTVRTNVQESRETHVPAALGELQDANGASLPGDLETGKTGPSESNKFIDVTQKLNLVTKRKNILNGISAYFNPRELIAIMGPSGCGKTTFLDLLTGRRKSDCTIGNVFVNGFPMEENRNWYINNTGYVQQLAAPYYEELTVRENLTLAAWVRLHISNRDKFQRVEHVMQVTGLIDLAETVVGGATGPGLSGGQKRRLVVALQLLKLPSVIFLDEPTSGLDSASSTELLSHLNTLAASNRTVVLTIHQPRLEIFHMFHRVMVLSEGKVAYHGVPEKAYEVFVNALQSTFLSQGVDIPPLEDHNPADVIMDMLVDQKMRKIVYNYYDGSGDQDLVKKAVRSAWSKEKIYIEEVDGTTTKANPISAKLKTLKLIFRGNRQAGRVHNYTIERLAALEARAARRASLVNVLYLPLIFFGYGFILGTVYFQTTTPFLVLSGFTVYSVASALFVFPAVYPYLMRALEIYEFEHADGAGRAVDLVIQPFVRFISIAFFPVIICAAVLYILLVDVLRWNLLDFLQIALVNVALNQTWTALLIWLVVAFPSKAIRLSPIIAAMAGFTSGFFIPINDIPVWYRWLSFINPNYYGFSSSAVIILSDFESDCVRNGGSELLCYMGSPRQILEAFNFNDVNPYQNIVILLGMTAFFLVLAVVSNWVRFLNIKRLEKKRKLILMKLFKRQPEYPGLSEDSTPPQQAETKNGQSSPGPSEEDIAENNQGLYLDDDQTHTVWKPQHSLSSRRGSRRDIHERRNLVLNRIWATQQVLKLQREDEGGSLSPLTPGPVRRRSTKMERKMWQRTINNVIAKKGIRRRSSGHNLHFHDVVSAYLAKTSTADGSNAATDSVTSQANEEARSAMKVWKGGFIEESKLQGMAAIPEESEPIIEDTNI